MSSINSVGGGIPIQSITSQPVQKTIPSDASDPTSTTPVRASDRLELSGASSLLQSLQTNNIRTDKVASIKSQIEAGTYESDSKLDVAVNKLLDELSA
jgi:anti-sigma28 factor (negative regulator of flagellin synthesis)